MLLQSDGTVLVQTGFNATDNEWYRLTPDANGSYINGTWTQIPSEADTRQFYASDILPDGRMFVAGGEYGTGTDNGEIYDPVSNTWQTTAAPPPLTDIGDCESVMLPDGRVLLGYRFGRQTRLYTPGPQSMANTGSWASGATNPGPSFGDEEAYALIPASEGGGVLDVNVFTRAAERYTPQAGGPGSWTIIAPPPVQLWDSAAEIGPTIALQDGRMMVIGSSDAGTPGHTAIYNPKTNTWVQGPDTPGGLVADDAPAAVMINGHVLYAADAGSEFSPPSSLFEYDPVTNTTTTVTPPGGASGVSCYLYRLLQLPNGQVLVSDSDSQLYVYTPAGGPLAMWRPTITGVVANGGGRYTLTGRQLTGRSEGTYYGDDVQNSSDFPLVRLTNTATGQVFYCRTFN
jgi:hypothetical protein